MLAGHQAGWEPSTGMEAAAGTWLDGTGTASVGTCKLQSQPSILSCIAGATF